MLEPKRVSLNIHHSEHEIPDLPVISDCGVMYNPWPVWRGLIGVDSIREIIDFVSACLHFKRAAKVYLDQVS